MMKALALVLLLAGCDSPDNPLSSRYVSTQEAMRRLETINSMHCPYGKSIMCDPGVKNCTCEQSSFMYCGDGGPDRPVEYEGHNPCKP